MRCSVILALLAGCAFDPSGAGAGATSDGPVIDGPVGDTSVPDAAFDAPPPSARRKAITIDGSKVSGMQTDFPVWIDLVDADIAARAQPDGHDIFFTAMDGMTVLDHQIQGFSPQAQHLSAWVRVPMLKTSPTVLYVNYGDPGRAPAANPAGVFRSSFAAVWHLDDALPATAIADATGMHAGVPVLTAATTGTVAKLGNGFTFTGSNDVITFTNPLAGNQAHTISVWVNQPVVNHASSVLVVGTPAAGQSRWFYTHFTAASLAVGYYNPDWTANDDLDSAGWTLVHWVSEGGNGKNHLYVNGAEIAGSPQTLAGVNTTGTAGFIGHAPEPAYGTNMGLQATIDELRIATVARTAGWIATEFANQSSPSTFYSIGAEESVP